MSVCSDNNISNVPPCSFIFYAASSFSSFYVLPEKSFMLRVLQLHFESSFVIPVLGLVHTIVWYTASTCVRWKKGDWGFFFTPYTLKALSSEHVLVGFSFGMYAQLFESSFVIPVLCIGHKIVWYTASTVLAEHPLPYSYSKYSSVAIIFQLL